MKNYSPLDMSKYLARDTLIAVCKDVCNIVRERIKYYYNSRHIKFDGLYSGECNRAALLFHIYFFKALKDKQFDIMKNCTFGEHGEPDYSRVNMHNVQAICAADPLALAGVVIDFVHGEQAHSTKIKEEYWGIEHTWIAVHYKDITVYADPTASQFKWLWHDIPDYYVSTRKPKWFYPDSENPRWNKNV